ncbi:hypothetical protein [Bradyrhizobium lablabi]|uniref:hypothetical protein n=1 Tax=Bradyrhizobium lablabi TaxID=722472 RepID=UPI0012ABAD70|nr:hypothetical protein [Bradyrhizobium lablabi]
MSKWIYGYFYSFNDEMRYGGFRPVVFMNNGLSAAFFVCTAFLASLCLSRIRRRLSRFSGVHVSLYLGIILILCKSAGALIYGLIFGAVVRWTKPVLRTQLAVILVTIAIGYPALRLVDYFPTNGLLSLAAAFNEQRADSLKVRFDQEQQLLERASDRLFFGWGRYGRSRVYEESGKDSTIVDGLWIITLGQFGLVGFIAQFGLLGLPVLRSLTALGRVKSQRERILLSTLALIVSITVIEQLPNASITPLSWLMAGALLGMTERTLFQSPVANRITAQAAEPRLLSRASS